MGTTIQHGVLLPWLVGVVIIVPVQPLICSFGAANIADLESRNWSYKNHTNAFLENYALNATKMILSVSKFNLTNFLVKDIRVDLTHQSYDVSHGILHKTDWAAVTAGFQLEVDLPAYIRSVYLNPVHTQMQYFADWYVISRGIYRPTSLEFFYSGFDSNVRGDEIVPGACYAGSRVVLLIATNMTYEASLVNYNSTEFAVFATMLELAFDQFFRGAQSIFTGDFVRVNVLSVNKTNVLMFVNRVAANMEFYFENVYNATYILDYIIRNITLLPPMAFNYNKTVPVAVLPSYVKTIQTDIAPTTPTTPSAPTTQTSTLKTKSSASITTQTTTYAYSTAYNLTTNSSLNVTKITPIITTFDSDPLFLAVAPVLPKKYNDPVMVPRQVSISHLAPQMKECLLKITLPVAAGIIGFVVVLLICLQSDWLPKSGK